MSNDILSQNLASSPLYVDLTYNSPYFFDLKYTTASNFLGHNLYGDFKGCFLHRMAAAKLQFAYKILKKNYPQASFLIYDALRPRSAQWEMWNKVLGTPEQKYIGDPTKGSMHNFGLAVDLTICDLSGKPWDMGTDFDHFSKLAEPEWDDEHLKSGQLTAAQVANRNVLYDVMGKSGFLPIKHEWWHYNATLIDKARSQYPIVE